ncbi:diheme cytochrome c [Sulfurimonas sp.]|uniref:diheme cytochrome c n=1 Tax=Sulfurimonas sp. TaxID=2022749 RepID=UPI002610F9AA|nr:diheme cytochrome c [Sulfurimonas sp.]
MKKIFVLLLVAGSLVYGDGWFEEGFSFGAKKAGVKPVDNKLYIEECGSCHFAYQPGLLPERSWKKLMANLEDHFQTDASLEEQDRKTLLAYLIKNSADKAHQYKRSKKIDRSIPSSQTPIAITQTPYFKHEHYEIPKRFIIQKEVRSLANCAACHTKADKGLYSESFIAIPNYGRWDDD